jgi:putative acetyltransferase
MADIRLATADDAAGIRKVHAAAFPTGLESDLVERLSLDGDSVISLVACEDGTVVGHALLSRMQVVGDGEKVDALGLGPVAVLPNRQRQRIGSELIEVGLQRAEALGAEMVFVLGEPDYYGRFGFDQKTARPFACPYAGPYFQATILAPGLGLPAAGSADYAPAFAELE